MANNYNCTFHQWQLHFDVFEAAGYSLADLDYIHDVALERVNDVQMLTGEMRFGITMVDLGFGNLSTVLLLNDRLGGVGGNPQPRQLMFEAPEVPNPYESALFEEENVPDGGVFEWEDEEPPLQLNVVDVFRTGFGLSRRVQIIPVWI